jgi:hypothetical protein
MWQVQKKWNSGFHQLYFSKERFPSAMQTHLSNKAFRQVRVIFGLLFLLLYLGNISVPLLHHLEVSHNVHDQALLCCGEFRSQQADFLHDEDSCSICLNILYNHFFELSDSAVNFELLPIYRDPVFIEDCLLQKRYFHFCQARAPPTLFAFL